MNLSREQRRDVRDLIYKKVFFVERDSMNKKERDKLRARYDNYRYKGRGKPHPLEQKTFEQIAKKFGYEGTKSLFA